ncbi:hypothetical protein DMT42_16940 [Streptomyces actuosus]|uniref:Uncharacterized protein n=1 Tax=Streptomyces actuosus TaxID=1885 RepID=A0A2U9PCQ1_STRAS|nr:hypothetical protein DMT42_16940 [Streptomyces actuosus]
MTLRPAPLNFTLLGTRRCGGAGVGRTARRYGVPLRPPVPPQRHDCPQLGQRGASGVRLPAAPNEAASLPRSRRPVDAYGGEGTCRGVSARSGRRKERVPI